VSFPSVLEPMTVQPAMNPRVESQLQTKPHLESFDSGEECSLAHLVQLYELLEIEDQEVDRYVFDDSCLHVA
jgi:hypothetical protein